MTVGEETDRPARQSWWDIPLTIVIALGVVLVITTFVAKPFSIPSGSMEDTLQIGDRVLVKVTREGGRRRSPEGSIQCILERTTTRQAMMASARKASARL